MIRRFMLLLAVAGCGEWIDTKPQDVDVDADADGYVVGQDCDDNDASAYPGAPVYCDWAMWGRDRNCDGVADKFDPACEGGNGDTASN